MLEFMVCRESGFVAVTAHLIKWYLNARSFLSTPLQQARRQAEGRCRGETVEKVDNVGNRLPIVH